MHDIRVQAHNEVSQAYLLYAVSTFNRSIPSSVDGLKVIQRRIVQMCLQNGYTYDSRWVKTARIAGEVMGQLSPHGSCGPTIQAMANASNYLQPLMAGHGNMGGWSNVSRQCISDDNPASERYTESKLSAFGSAVFDIPIKYLKTKPNYDGSSKEVVEFVPALPLGLINSQSGISVGYSTSTIGFPIKNVIEAIKYVHEEPKAIKKLGFPDLPFNTNIEKTDAAVTLHQEGSASFNTIGEWYIDKNFDTGNKRNRYREAVVITKIACGNAEKVLDQIKVAVSEGKFECAEVHDQTSTDIKIVVVCKAGQKAEILLESLLHYTNVKSKESIRMLFLKDLTPKQFTPIELLKNWYQTRSSTLVSMYSDLLEVDKATLNVKSGILSVYSKLQKIALLIMEADSIDDAKAAICGKYKLEEPIVDAILALQLKALVKISKEKLEAEISHLTEKINKYTILCNNSDALHEHIVELATLASKSCTPRVSAIIEPSNVKVPVAKEKELSKEDKGYSTRAFNKAKALYSGKGKEYTYCKSLKDLEEAVRAERHPFDDVPKEERLKKSRVKTSRKGKAVVDSHSPELDDNAVRRANNKGILTSARLKEHIDYWSK